MSDRWDCLCAGIIVADQVCEPIAAFPPAGALCLTPKLSFTIGGCAANVAADLAKLDARVGISGCVGTDFFGQAVCEMLEQAGVDCRGIQRRSEQPTSGTFVINVRGEDRRFIHCIGANALYDGTQVSDADLQRTGMLYVGGYCLLDSLSPQHVSELFSRARRAGVSTILDVVIGGRENCWDWVAPVLPFTDLFLPNYDEAKIITELEDPWDQAARLREGGCREVVITCGGDGVIYDGPDGRLRAGVYNVPTIDPTGTGDAFVAGFLHGRMQGASSLECLRFGSALGASCVQAVGATTGVFNARELQEFMSANPLSLTASY